MAEETPRGQESEAGFGLAGLLAVVVVLVVVGTAGWLVYRRDHGTARKDASTTSSTTTPKTAESSTTQQPVDPYVGWQTYTDSEYHYSFMYPTGWALTSTTGHDIGGVRLLSPSQTVVVEYGIGQPQSSGTVAVTPVSIDKLVSANEALTVVGYIGYGANSANGQYGAAYSVIDNSELTQYPQVVGTSGQIPIVQEFTVGGNATILGGLLAGPTGGLHSLADAQSWFASADAKTSLLILESLKYDGS